MHFKGNKKNYWFIAFFLLLLLIYLFHPIVIKNVVKHRMNALAQHHDIHIEIAKIKAKYNHTVFLEGILFYANSKSDTILYCKNMMLDLKMMQKMKVNPSLENLVLNDLSLFLRNSKSDTISSSEEKTPQDPVQKINKILTFFNYLPKQLAAYSIHIEAENDSLTTLYLIDTLLLKNDTISGKLTVKDGQQFTCWSIMGKALPEEGFYSGELHLEQKLTKNTKLAFIERLLNANFLFERLSFNLNITQNTADKTNFSFGGEIESCKFFHQGIADKEIKIDSASFLLNVELEQEKIEIQHGSLLALNGFAIHPYFLYEKNAEKRVVFALNERDMDVEKLVQALPKDIFQMITRMGLSGKLDFAILFDCDFANPESLKFNFELASPQLNIPPSGRKMITRLEEDFNYDCVLNDIVYKQIEVSEKNPKFVKFDNIPFYLMHAILVCEDPSFFRHNGILQSTLRESMVTNLKKKEYKRGGSTLSMQFVKNVFLHKKKLITRKIEEIVLVWLIEENRLLTKERMFEIYVNVIEWAPLVYGLHDAADFYFRKTPDMLNFGECVYLATLIRSPKKYDKTIAKDGELTENRRTEMNFIVQRMTDRGMITEEQLKTFNSFVRLDIDSAKVIKWDDWKIEREKDKKRQKKKSG